MSRELKTHEVGELNENIFIDVMDEPGDGGANHRYLITHPTPDEEVVEINLHFQEGPIKEAGINGISVEALLAIVIDRLEGFESGPYACFENARALDSIKTALWHLQSRTRDRVARGVEGTHEK